MNSSPIFSDLEARRHRCDLYLKAVVEASRDWYDRDGKWIGGKPTCDTRERFWIAFAHYAMGENAWGDAIVREGKIENSREYRGKATTYNIFWTNIAVALLAAHGNKIGPDARAVLEQTAREALQFLPGSRQPDYQFIGYNDNMPAKASMGTILAGEMFGDEGAVLHGVNNLRQMRSQLTRRGIHSEYNSPTYTPGTLLAMSKIVEYAKNEEARELARQIEERLWIDLAARFHPEMGLMAGPYSRAYTVDTLGGASGVSGMVWFALGDYAKPSPMELFDPKSKLTNHHQGDIPFIISEKCWQALTYQHIPETALRLFAEKQYPFRAVATAEMGDCGPDWPARATRIETHLERDFTVGTASTPFLSSEQAASYFVTYKRKPEVRTWEDYGTVHTKLVVNDAVPGAFNAPAKRANGTPYSEFVEQDNLDNRGNNIAMQSGPTALFLSHPHLALAGEADNTAKGGKMISRLSEFVLFQNQFGGAEEILVGGETRAEWKGEVAHGQWIAARRGRLLIAIRPLNHTIGFGPPRMTLEKINRYDVIRTDLYRREPRLFTRTELRYLMGGFVAEHASVDDYGSLRDFVADLERTQFTDYLFTTRRVRYRRPAGAKRPALEMEISWSPGSHEPRFSMINGKLVTWPVVEIDTVAPESLPFLRDQWQSIPSYFPWKKLEVAYTDSISSIGDRES
jgi:hypothetical protein